MDTTKTTTHIGLCAGYGGIELGLKRVIPNLRSVALCEIEAFACANLVAKMEAGLMEPAPIWTDLKTFPWESFRDRVDILTGGYPCQPFSAAGKRLGTEDPRHLWPYIAGGIRILRPKLCFFENVEGHISLGLREVIGELESMGYKVSWGIFSAREVGAPHQRKRVFILAVSNSLGGAAGLSRSLAWNERIAGEFDHGGGEGVGELANASGNGHNGRELQDRVEGWKSGELPQPRAGKSSSVWSQTFRCGQVWPSRPGEPQHAWEPPRVVVDAKGQRAGQRSELRGEECGSGSALPRDIEQSGEATLANNHRPHAGHGEQRPERTLRDLSGGCGEGSGSMANSNSNEPSEGRGDDGEVPQIPAGEWKDNGSIISGGEGELSGEEVLGNATLLDGAGQARGQREAQTWRTGATQHDRQTQPALGGNAYGSSDRLDYAELQVSCDNRTDELRLLGNGVVPATAERAFRTLLSELNT